MKPDYEYIIDILNVFIDSEKPTLYVEDFHSFREEDNDKFCFNILIMKDKGILEGAGKKSYELGISFSGNNDRYEVFSYPWRLTATGHDFAKDIVKPEIQKVIVSKFKYEGIGAIIDITKKLGIKRLEKLLGDVEL